MIYLDNGATSFPKPPEVEKAMVQALRTCANAGRGGYSAADAAARTVYTCRETAGKLFSLNPEQVIMTGGCTQGLNMAIRTLFKPGDRVAISGFEHNAVVRTLWGLQMKPEIFGRKLFDWEDTLEQFEKTLDRGADGAVFTHVSNVFGYILPAEEMAAMCRSRNIPFILDAAQSAGTMEINFRKLGADYIAVPGHKGLLGPQGTGLLLCKAMRRPVIFGGTGSLSREKRMPDFLPEGMEAGTLNIPGIAGLTAGMEVVLREGPARIGRRETIQARAAAEGLKNLGMQVFSGPHQGGTVSFVPSMDCEEAAVKLQRQGIAVRAGLHCAPLAHESVGTLETGTVRVSFGKDADFFQTEALLQAVSKGT